jgi:hypothetical protein
MGVRWSGALVRAKARGIDVAVSGTGRDVHAASIEDRPGSLISCLIFGRVRACGWMRGLMVQAVAGAIECQGC